MLEGRLTCRFADHEETVHAGEAFYLPPGHVPVGNDPNSVIVQISPTDELRKVHDMIMQHGDDAGSVVSGRRIGDLCAGSGALERQNAPHIARALEVVRRGLTLPRRIMGA